ncbi:hypothetical protein N1851_003636 [Merluccius polli]|uniref:Uncharacterized protein n=1 Tax=Merluccius polli TaxID=89951 RepID=A0AA47P7R8_MERPO|nr:hypothetical protein N1851_003636 [Merluccius polli]
MDEELALNASDCDLLDEISNTPEASETSSSPVIPARQPPRLRSTVHVRRRPSPSISDSSNIVGPSQPHSPRGRTRLRRPSYTADSRRSSPARSRSSHASDRRNRREAISPRQHAVRPSATGIADWTVASLKRSLTRHNIPFHSSDRKATLFQRLQDFQLNSASPRRTPLPGYRRNDDVTPPSPAQPPLAQPPPLALTQGQLPQLLRLQSRPQQTPRPHLRQQSTAAPPPPAGSSLFPLYPPPPPNYTLATASLPVRPTASSRPSPVSSTLRQQILSGNYVDLAQLIHPSTCNPHIPRELQTSLGTFQLKQPLTTHSKELTAPEFTFAFSLFRDIICSAFPDRRSELDDYLSLTIDLALRFGGNGFYSYHILFASRAAERLQQFNQGTYWGTLDTELYCRIFAARSSLNCEQCGAPSHPATTCTLTTPLPNTSFPQKRNQAVFRNLPPAAPPPSITPKPAASQPTTLGPAPKGVDRRGRPILYQGGRVLCNNFNDLGCNSSNCRFLHTCSFCGGAHARVTCPHNPTKHGPCKYLSTPINIHALTSALKNHPDRQFVHYLLQGFTHGFHPGLHFTPDSSFSCHNLQSANSEPDTVDRLLTKEVKETFMIAFHTSHNLPFPTLDVRTFSSFITFAHSIQKIKSSTIQVYLSGINFFAKLSSGSPCPALTHAHISMLLKGLRKAEPRPMPKRLPLTSDLLTRCIETLRKGYLSPSTDEVLESMFLLAFFGFLRCSEFTASTLLYDPSRHASVSDISVLSSDTLVYFLKRSKTNQSETGRVATRSWFHHHFRQILSRSGIPPEPYSGHSFRIGAASTTSRQGIPDNITKILGRWSSTAYLTYVRNDLSDDFSRPPVNPKTTLTDGPASSLYPSSSHPSYPSSLPFLPLPLIPTSLLPFFPSLPPSPPSSLIPTSPTSDPHPTIPPSLDPSNPPPYNPLPQHITHASQL